MESQEDREAACLPALPLSHYLSGWLRDLRARALANVAIQGGQDDNMSRLYNPARDLFSEKELTEKRAQVDAILARFPVPDPDIALLSHKETAALLGVASSTLRSWRERGYISSISLTHHKYQLSEIKAFLSPGKSV